eukprot:5986356-Amphidinium_carterae.2
MLIQRSLRLRVRALLLLAGPPPMPPPSEIPEPTLGEGEDVDDEDVARAFQDLPGSKRMHRVGVNRRGEVEAFPQGESEDDMKKVVSSLHRDLGHTPPHLLAKTLQLRGAKQELVELVLKHECAACQRRRAPTAVPKARLIRAHHLNDCVAVDTFKMWDTIGQILYCANFVDEIGYQIAVPLGWEPPSNKTTWLTFVTNWLRLLGVPSEMRCDSGPEFPVHMNPWLYPQANGIVERHGGFFKYIAQAAMLGCEYVFRIDDNEQPVLCDQHFADAFADVNRGHHEEAAGVDMGGSGHGFAERIRGYSPPPFDEVATQGQGQKLQQKKKPFKIWRRVRGKQSEEEVRLRQGR